LHFLKYRRRLFHREANQLTTLKVKEKLLYLQSSEDSLQVRDTHMAPSVLLSLSKDNPITKLNKNQKEKARIKYLTDFYSSVKKFQIVT